MTQLEVKGGHIQLISVVGYTDTGYRRELNEDSFAWESESGVIALADGMGGHQAGEVASAMAVSLFISGFRYWLDEMGAYLNNESLENQGQLIRTWLIAEMQSIHDSIWDAASIIPDCAGMGTTLCGVIIRDGQIWVAHIGDSRAYLFDRGTQVLHCLTRDHSVVQEQIDQGVITAEAALQSPQRHKLTQALGIGEVRPDISVDEFDGHKVLLLCSDGLSDVVSEALMTKVLKEHPIELAGRLLLSQANALGGQDDVSIVLAENVRHSET